MNDLREKYEMRHLLDCFWITRSWDKDLYYEIKRALPRYRRFINEHLGWNLIVNESVIKLEKVAPRSMAWMGIEDFNETLDYSLLCVLLLYLADQEDGGQFLLSSLTEAIETYMTDLHPIDWTLYQHRKSLVRVLRYAQSTGLLIAYDGSSESFGNSQDQEVLYENTGLSRHFTVHFDRDISSCRTVEDFEAFAWEGDSERGRQRVNRVYRQLTLAPALYWSEGDRADYEYIKNQHPRIDKYLDEVLCGELQIYRNGAFFVLNQENRFGAYYPKDSALSDVVLLLCSIFREQVNSNKLPRLNDDTVILTHREFRQNISQCRDHFSDGWGKQLRELPDEKLYQELLDYMTGWMMLEDRNDHLVLYPAAAKWIGHYPKSYTGGN